MSLIHGNNHRLLFFVNVSYVIPFFSFLVVGIAVSLGIHVSYFLCCLYVWKERLMWRMYSVAPLDNYYPDERL